MVRILERNCTSVLSLKKFLPLPFGTLPLFDYDTFFFHSLKIRYPILVATDVHVITTNQHEIHQILDHKN
jgi:hypothetical protein